MRILYAQYLILEERCVHSLVLVAVLKVDAAIFIGMHTIRLASAVFLIVFFTIEASHLIKEARVLLMLEDLLFGIVIFIELACAGSGRNESVSKVNTLLGGRGGRRELAALGAQREGRGHV